MLPATALLYAAFMTGANPVAGGTVDPAVLEAMRVGEMRKLAVHDAPQESSDLPFADVSGEELRLSDFSGKTVLLNFWATWCAPCRKEMPALDAIQEQLGGEDFAVIAVATGRNDIAKIEAFYAEQNIRNLPIYIDDGSALARDMGVLGLPITVILNEAGLEIARMRGDADWASDSAYNILKAIIDAPKS